MSIKCTEVTAAKVRKDDTARRSKLKRGMQLRKRSLKSMGWTYNG